MIVLAYYLTREGETISFVCALDDMSHALHGMHELCELIRAQIRDTRNGTCRTYEHVCEGKGKSIVVSVYPTCSGGGVDRKAAARRYVRPGTIGLRFTIA